VARTEARIFTSIWKDQDFLAHDPGAQRLYLFLLSQEELTYCGVMPLRIPRWARKAAGLTVADVERQLKALEGTAYPSPDPASEELHPPFVITDEETGELFTRSLLRRDGAWKQPNLLKQARESAEQIESPRIRAALLAELRRIPVDESPSSQVRTLVAEFIADLDQGSPYPSAYPPDHPAGNPPDDPSDDPSGMARAHARIPPTPISGAPTTLPAPAARDRKTGTRLPDPFIVTDEMKVWFGQNCPHVNPRVEHDKFLDYWRAKPGKDGRKLDWAATWRNWMRTAEDRQGPRQRPSSAAVVDRRQQATDEMFDAALVRARARDAEEAAQCQ
jgi:hypothetical protein